MRTCAFFAVLMDVELFVDMLEIDSTSGKEDEFVDFLVERMSGAGRRIETFEVTGGGRNLLVSWGEPKVFFCTHLDTVPPYIPPVLISNESHHKSIAAADKLHDGTYAVRGRGTCDAKGQILAMWEACKVLESRGCDGFALLLLAGEETGSSGAKAFSRHHQGGEWIIIGEPTDNCMASAAKGTKTFEVTFSGKACHSGYPQFGLSAVEMFNDFMNALRSIRFPYDEVLGETTWNIGCLVSDNPQNILSDHLSCRVYFRTTFESDEMVCNIMKNMAGPDARLRFGRPKVQDGSDLVAKDVALWQACMTVEALGGDSPSHYETFDGFDVKPVSFGSDAPHLTDFPHKILCGPGSILVAHGPEENITFEDMEVAVANYVRMYEIIAKK